MRFPLFFWSGFKYHLLVAPSQRPVPRRVVCSWTRPNRSTTTSETNTAARERRSGTPPPPLIAKTRMGADACEAFSGRFWCLRSKGTQPRQPGRLARGCSRSRAFLGRAEPLERLTRVSDLRTAAGDREHESNGVRLCPACFSDKTNERSRLRDPVGACGRGGGVLGPAECFLCSPLLTKFPHNSRFSRG